MPPLPARLFRSLETAITSARTAAEKAAGDALAALAVMQEEPFRGITPEQRRLRNALRARARQLGRNFQMAGYAPLQAKIAYEQWHRMLFARFLAENSLLLLPSGTPVTLAECAQLALSEGEEDGWTLAARYASAMLPGIFRQDDPCVQIRLSTEGRLGLERILNALPTELFTSDDGLGWVYQFWQAKRKKEVNASGVKIGGAELPAVTQLFTEDYMVRFLLENSLGAWWAARHPESPLLKDYAYLRYKDDGTPAAGTFPGWPEHASQVTMMDPCCGSGHFLVATFDMLRTMRMEEEGLDAPTAGNAVIRDNLFGLELDPRCTQLAAFALALAAWKTGGYRQLPLPNIACSGIPVTGQLEEWTKLADGDPNVIGVLTQLYQLFQNAPELGSLIDPRDVPSNVGLYSVDYAKIEPLLEKALAQHRGEPDPVATLFGETAVGMVRAAKLLAGQYTLLATNMPYRKNGDLSDTLRVFAAQHHPLSKGDIATCFIDRCMALCSRGHTAVFVAPHNWLFQPNYEPMRRHALGAYTWNALARIGEKGFESPQAAGAFVALYIFTASPPTDGHHFLALNASMLRLPKQKAECLRSCHIVFLPQHAQLNNPEARITIDRTLSGTLLSTLAYAYKGITSGDDPRYRRKIWELPSVPDGWRFLQSSVTSTGPFGGCEHLIWLAALRGHPVSSDDGVDARRSSQEKQVSRVPGVYIRGQDTWGKYGIAVSQMRSLHCALSTGEPFDTNVAVILPRRSLDLPALWAYCSSAEFSIAVRNIDQALKVTNGTLTKVPFDLASWQSVADKAGPLPEPHSDDPTQWLFNGHPAGATDPLQVAVARLLGYHWPQQKDDNLTAYEDDDGIVCLPPVSSEQPAAERLRALLTAALSPSPSMGGWMGEGNPQSEIDRLLAAAGYAGKTLDDWLRNGFFLQHCRVFDSRPFIWHIWDGRPDGFSALVNYHKLNASTLNKLIYTYLARSWISVQRADFNAGVPGAEARLIAAQQLQKKLELIRDGEPDYDIHVRWKPLEQQPIGWNPDLNDGVRLNIRPFVIAGVLRAKVNINWKTDPGTNPDGSKRDNDKHLTIADKRAARAGAASAGAEAK